MKALLVELWRAGELPLWDPYVRNGLPFLANPQAGVFYPPSVLLVLLGVNPGLTLFILLHLAAAGAGFYLFLRAAGFAPLPSLLGAIAFGMGGPLASLVNVLNNLQAAVWIPWILLFAMRLGTPPRKGSWIGLTLSATLVLLAGELQLAALGIATGLALVLALAPPERAEKGSLWARLAGGGVFGLAIIAALALAAVQLLPTAELLRESVRQGGLPFELAAADSFDPASLFSLAFPRPALPGSFESGVAVSSPMPWLLSAYMGIGVVLLGAVGVVGPRRRWTIFWCAATLAGGALALGSESIVFRLAYEALPPFRSVRYPEKFLLLAALALPALAAAGMERLLARKVPPAGLILGIAFVIVSAAGSLLWMRDPARAAPREALAAGAFVGVVLVGGLLLLRREKLGPAAAGALFCGISALDLGCQAQAVNPGIPWRFYDESWAASVLAREGGDPRTFRIRSSPLTADMEQVAVIGRARLFSNHYLFQQSLAPNLGQLYGYLEQDGMAGIETRATADLIDELVEGDPRRALRLLRLLGVKYLVTSFPLPGEDVAHVASHDELPLAVVKLRDPLPRAYLASRWEVVAEARAALDRALENGFSAGREVVLERAPRGMQAGDGGSHEALGESAPPGHVRRATWRPASAELDVELERAALLVVTDTHYPGWRVRIDGRPGELLRANGYQRALAVPAGSHRVVMDYRPSSLTSGAALSGFALLLIVGVAVLPLRKRRLSSGTLPKPAPFLPGGPAGDPATGDPASAERLPATAEVDG